MPCNTKAPTIRWFYLTIGILSMLFAGILYSWSILKAPLADAFGWNASQLTMNFTLTMCFFCLGGVGGGLLARRLGTRLTIALGGALACIGFVLTARLDGSSLPMLYLSYGVITATGIGFAYNVVLSTVQAWFPDKKGTCSGALLMGFGASSLVLGSLADALIQNPAVGWRAAFLCLGVAIGIVLVAAALLIRLPAPGTVLPQPKAAANRVQEDFEAADYTTGQMLRRFTFWRAFLCIIFLAAMGNTVISFAKDLSLSVGASAALSTTLVGVLAVCNGLGRILTGALFDTLGRRRTMLLANGAAILAALVTLLSVAVHSVPLCVAGLCITGISYGACPTISSAFTSSFYGAKYFSLNFSVMNFNLTGASFVATAASVLLTQTGGYAAPLVLLLVLPLFAVFTRHVQKRMLAAQLDNRRAVAAVSGQVPETLHNIRTIRALGLESYRERRYDRCIGESYAAMERTNFYDAIYSPVVLALNAVVAGIVMLLSASGNAMVLTFFGMSVGTSVAIINYISRIFAPIESLGMEIQTIQSAMAGVNRIDAFLAQPERTIPAERRTAARGDVELAHVTFGYGEKPVLSDFSMTVKQGGQVTLVGRTGAGKSTVFKLLLGLYQPQAGTVTIGGVDVARITDRERRTCIGCVEQHFSRVPGTVLEQITLGDPQITAEMARNAAKLAGIDEAIQALPEGCDTICSDGMFSQGEWQLLSIARAAAADPAVLLLDEVTANLDAETEARVLEALRRASAGRTVLSVSHRIYENLGGRTVKIEPQSM